MADDYQHMFVSQLRYADVIIGCFSVQDTPLKKISLIQAVLLQLELALVYLAKHYSKDKECIPFSFGIFSQLSKENDQGLKVSATPVFELSQYENDRQSWLAQLEHFIVSMHQQAHVPTLKKSVLSPKPPSDMMIASSDGDVSWYELELSTLQNFIAQLGHFHAQQIALEQEH